MPNPYQKIKDKLAPFAGGARVFIGLILPGLLLSLNLYKLRFLTMDDAYISFRYARNLAEGLGFVYNAGERIEGYTNFLWVFLF